MTANNGGQASQDVRSRRPRVSVGMPVYNAERYLSDAFDSLLAQDFTDFEIIVSDNASTDRTWEICRQYAAHDPRVRLYGNEKNLGAAYNYNRTVELAQGELFKWAAYDDVCAPGFLRACVDELDHAGTEAVLAYPKTILIDEQGREIKPYRDGMDLRARKPRSRLAALARNLSLCNAVMGVIRAGALRKTGLIRPYAASDIVLLAELAALGEIHEVPEHLFYRRIHALSSRQGTMTDRKEIARWFDPYGTERAVPSTAWNTGHVLLQTELPLLDRASSAMYFVSVWGARKAHIRGSHMKRWLLRNSAGIGTSNNAQGNDERNRTQEAK